MSKSAADPRARRYSMAERAEVLDYIAKVNAEHGGGGRAAAKRKYGIAQLTLTSWMRDQRIGYASAKVTRTLAAMTPLAERIDALEKQLARLRAEVDRLKAEM
jgi:transposase-like protein